MEKVIKQHTLQSGERILLVKVPSDAKWLTTLNPQGIRPPLLRYNQGIFGQEHIALPKGNWQLIGLSDEITEEQAKGLVLTRVDQSSFPTSMEYYNYLSDRMVHLSFDFDTALESFKSLMQLLELYEEIPAPKCGCYGPSDKGCCEGCDEWVEAQSKVGRYAVLKEVKL